MMRKLSGLLVAGVLLMAAPVFAAPIADGDYDILNISGQQSPPIYGLRLDGFFTGNGNDEVTFAWLPGATFSIGGGAASVTGTVVVAEFNNSGTNGGYTQSYDVNINFVEVFPSANPDWRYFDLVAGSGPEMVNTADATDFVNIIGVSGSYPANFQVGDGANQKNANLGATGWVNYEHTMGSTTYGSLSTHIYSSDLLFDLELQEDEEPVIPEPATLTLLGLGLASGALVRRRKKA